MSPSDKTMDCQPEPLKKAFEPSAHPTNVDVFVSQDKSLLPSDGQETPETVEVIAKPVDLQEIPESLERHNFQALELDMQLKEMSLKFKTQNSLDPQVYALLGQLGVIQNDIRQSQDKLDVANRTIGFLEAQIRVQQAQIEELRANSDERARKRQSLFERIFALLTGRS